MNWDSFILTFQLATITTLLLLVFVLPLVHWLAYSKSFLRPFVETIINLPFVLPPTVLGFYFLIVFSPQGELGGFLNKFLGIDLLFSFQGLVLASMIYSLPFITKPILAGVQALPSQMRNTALLMGKSKLVVFLKVILPNVKNSIVTACVLCFAHVIGEFGIVLMIGGNLEGETKVASIAIYEQVESLNFDKAHIYAAILLSISFLILFGVHVLNKRQALW